MTAVFLPKEGKLQHQEKIPGAVYATFSDFEVDSGSTINDRNFAFMLNEFMDTEIFNLELKRSHGSLVVAYLRMLRNLLVVSRHRWVICRGVVVGSLGLLTSRKIVLFLGDGALSSLETRANILPARTSFRALDYITFYSLERFAITKTHTIIVSNTRAQELLSRNFDLLGKTISVIPWFVGKNFFDLPALHAHNGALKIGYAGNFMTHDLVKELIDAAQSAVKMGTPLELHLVGDGPLREPAQIRAKQASGFTIYFWGRIRHSIIPAFLRDLDVFLAPMDRRIMPSTLPIKILEAAAAGKAIITSDCGALKSVFKDSMIYVEEPVIENTARAISALFRNPQLRLELGGKARRYATDNFSHPIVQKAMKNFLGSYLAK